MNENYLRVYDISSGSPISDPDGLLDRAQPVRFSTVYPGGIFDACSFFIPCDPTRYSPLKHNDRVVIRNGLLTVWEGFITSIALVVNRQRQGIDVQATGMWALAFKRYKYNRWIDRRFQSNIYGMWTADTATTGGTPKTEFDQNNRLLLKPKAVDWSYDDASFFSYLTNGSSNVKRAVFTHDLGTTSEVNPVRAKKYTSAGATYSSNLSNMIDGNTTTSQTVSMAVNDYLYIGLDDASSVTGVRFDFGGTVNANAATLTAEYYGVDAAWHTIAITDGTSSGGKTWAVDGSVTFTAIDGWAQSSVSGTQNFFYLRFSVNAGLTANVVILDVYILRAQSWTLMLYDRANSATLWSTSTAGTGAHDITLAPSSYDLIFRLRSDTAQKVVGNGVYGKITNLALVAESWDGDANVTVETMLQDMVHYLGSPFKDDYTYIAANTYSLLSTGFVADDLRQSLAQQMQFIGQFSATDEAYSVGVLESDAVGGSNTSAVVYYEKFPSLTDYDYAVRLDEAALEGVEIVLSADVDTLYNFCFVNFTRDDGKQNFANYYDYAGLEDTASEAKYYQRTLIVEGRQASTPALAGPYGAAKLAQKKNLAMYMRGPLQLQGTIRRKDGTRVPVSTVRAGKRIKIENFNVDLGDVLGSGLTFLIGRTEYDTDSQTLTVTAMNSDDIAAYVADRT